MASIAQNQGALLMGGFVALGYVKATMIAPILDQVHSGLVCATIWRYLIEGNGRDLETIPIPL
ncbi:hypothetical protein DXG03_006289 [Asterophora parasitica]|uniref:Uncharacterized protein n=1 Tax=Asterophora parasitica TaxID=117018 RepID=A0A9P7K9E4_9AGAR|nr:hypothetical protein DXG03_006289 [Asterophora parasitica]